MAILATDVVRPSIFALAAVAAFVFTAVALSRKVLGPGTSRQLRLLFIWHAVDAQVHFILEGGLLYFCFFSSLPMAGLRDPAKFFPDPYNYLGTSGRVHGAQAAGSNIVAQLFMLYARADRRSAGVDLTVTSVELLTVFVVAPLSTLVCLDIAKGNPRAEIVMIMVATATLYGDFMTFNPEWLTGSLNLNTSNPIYKWGFLVGSTLPWILFPLYALYVAGTDIMDAFRSRRPVMGSRKTN